jgi:hypothetical protein
MNRHLQISAVIALAFAAVLHAAETDTPIGKLPEPVQKAMRELVGKGKITKTVKETEKDGTVLYEVSYLVGKKKFEAEVSPEGKVLVVDEEIQLSEAPEAVRKVIEEKTAGGKIRKIEKAVKGKEVFYEAEFTKGGEKHEVKVAPGGKVLAEE